MDGTLFVIFIEPSVLAKFHGDLSQMMQVDEIAKMYSKSPTAFVGKGQAFYTPPGWSTLSTGVDTRSEAALRADRVKSVGHPFVQLVFYPLFSVALAVSAGPVVVNEMGLVIGRGEQFLPREGIPRMSVAVKSFLTALNGQAVPAPAAPAAPVVAGGMDS